MTTSTFSAFRYAAIAALPICLAAAFVAGEQTASRGVATIGAGPQTYTQCIAGVSQPGCPDDLAATIVPFLGEITVTASRSDKIQPSL
ncbi:MAG TPA: hypothetical protein VEZ88_08185 [Steroidobacteraceae bacterium]|nr:hypothetical protein [Steroidobacteraceae bacterium]